MPQVVRQCVQSLLCGLQRALQPVRLRLWYSSRSTRRGAYRGLSGLHRSCCKSAIRRRTSFRHTGSHRSAFSSAFVIPATSLFRNTPARSFCDFLHGIEHRSFHSLPRRDFHTPTPSGSQQWQQVPEQAVQLISKTSSPSCSAQTMSFHVLRAA